MNIGEVNNKRELEDVVQKLRLKQIPFTLETLEKLRNAIQKPKLDELLKKYIERDFVIRWQQLCAQHKLVGWPDGFRQPFEVKFPKASPKVTQKFTFEEEKPVNIPFRKKKDTKKTISKPPITPYVKLFQTLPDQFHTPTELERYVTILRNNPEYIPQYIKIIASRIPNKILRRTFWDRMSNIYITRNDLKVRNKHIKTAKIAESTYITKGKVKVKPKSNASSQGIYLDRSDKQKFVKQKTTENHTKLYDTYEYGLSDW